MPDGTVHPGATHEEYMAMSQRAPQQMAKYGKGKKACYDCGGPIMRHGGNPELAHLHDLTQDEYDQALTGMSLDYPGGPVYDPLNGPRLHSR